MQQLDGLVIPNKESKIFQTPLISVWSDVIIYIVEFCFCKAIFSYSLRLYKSIIVFRIKHSNTWFVFLSSTVDNILLSNYNVVYSFLLICWLPHFLIWRKWYKAEILLAKSFEEVIISIKRILYCKRFLNDSIWCY